MQGTPRKGSIVVGIDGSAVGKLALEWAVSGASTRKLPLLLVHAFSPEQPTFDFGVGHDQQSVRAEAEQLLARSRSRALAHDPTLEVATVVANGYASGALVRASYDAAYVVVGAHGHGPLSLTPIGSVALQVATHAHCPVVVVRHNESGHEAYRRVVVGVDGSQESIYALHYGFAQAEMREAELLVVHAWQARSAEGAPAAQESSWPASEAAQRRAVEEVISGETARRQDVKVGQEVPRGKPGKILAERSQSADLVVVGSRGLGGFQGLRLGSVAHHVLDRSSCPVVVMRTRSS